MRSKRRILAGILSASVAWAGFLGSFAGPAQAATVSPVHMAAPAAQKSAAQKSAVGKWHIRNSFFGKNGEDVPLRQGDLKFGYKHIQDKHPEDDTSLIGWIDDTLEDGKYEEDEGSTVVRNRTATGKMFRVVFSEREDEASKDGRPVGIITAFLE
ncbi:hypothetical protein NCG97_27055 [Streptomyces lydicamycinicus]|uniref:hypothetical protein n=1 Tax=Streptomyces lydicamycinicus TaxID=1546107 RepID=UPI002034C855|nr:hypothetical protein [Streptomyces lydicamycinicus]USA03455.1 hypothetical protein NCG97_27055 [Streptomyces lydicamycinicus]